MSETALENIGKRVKEGRGKMGLTQEEFADKYNYPRTTIAKIEAGLRDIKSAEIVKLAKQLGVTTDYLLGVEPAPSHAATDVCRYTGLAPHAVEVLKMYATAATSNLEWAKFFNGFDEVSEPLPQTTTELGLKTLNHIIANCNELLAVIGLYLFGEITGVENAKVEGYSITLEEPDEFIRNGFLRTMTLTLAKYRKALKENGGDLPLTWVLDTTKEERKVSFVKQRVDWLEQQKGKPLTEAEIQQQVDLWERGQIGKLDNGEQN